MFEMADPEANGGVEEEEMESLDNADSNIATDYTPKKLSGQGITQIIKFSGDDEHHSEKLTCARVTLIPSQGVRTKCSPNVNLKSRVDYTWEHKFYTGQLLAVHIGGRYIAYGLRAGQNNGIVRVVNRLTNERGLIKGMEGLVQDIAFAHIEFQILLGIVDERGSLFVYAVEENQTTKALSCVITLHVINDVKPEPGCNHRIIWVPYMPDEGDVDTKEDGDNAKLLVLALGSKALLWHVATVIAKYGPGPHKTEELDEGLLIISEHTKSIVDATFSPEGSALATVSLDGTIKFFQVYMQQKVPPRCLHNWRPHDGKPLSSIFFLDNHKSHNPESQFWKFVITGAENNTELKVWGCIDWTCLQTIRFSPDLNSKKSGLYLKAGLDLGARHLVLTDIYNQVIYVLRIYVDSKETIAFVCSASEFIIPFSILSFGIVDAGTRHCKTNSFGLEEHDDVEDPEDEDVQEAVVILMYLVQPKSMQECCIRFLPPSNESDLPLSTFIPDSLDPKAKKDVDSMLPDAEIYNNVSNNSYKSPGSLNLMTPEEFTTPAKKEEDFESKEDDTTINQDVYSSFQRDVLVSGGSSPSREVQEILSLQGNNSGREVEDLINLQPSQRSYYPGGDIPDLEVDKMEPVQLNDREGLKSNVQSSNGWPHVPILKPDEDMANRMNARASQENCDVNSESVPDANFWKLSQRIDVTLSNILATVQQQESQIRDLRQEVSVLRSRQTDSVITSVCKSVLEQHSILLEEQLTRRDTKERERQEKLMSAVSQAVTTVIATKFEEIVSNKIKDSVLPAILGDMDQLKRQLHLEMSQKLSATDHLLKDNISKLVNSKAVMEVLSLTLASTIRPSIADICKDLFTEIVIPRCEKALDRLFVQVHETFTLGTREYILQTQKELEKMRQQILKGSELLVEYETTARETRDKLCLSVQQDLQLQVQKSFASLQERLYEVVKDSISKGFHTHKSLIEDSVITAVRSRAVTPASHIVDKIQICQAQIMHAVAAGRINCAFQQALSASDLNLVVYLCDKLNPETLFRQNPCPLQQAVLLSLIQQLSADMSDHTDLKYKYLEEAIMNLDLNDPMTKEHSPGVLTTLQKELNFYLTNNPGSKHTRNIRMLLMMTQSLIPGAK